MSVADSLVEDAARLWGELQARDTVDTTEPDVEPAVVRAEHERVDDAVAETVELTDGRNRSVYDAEAAVAALNHGYVSAAVAYAADVLVENGELRKIAAEALVRARNVDELRARVGGSFEADRIAAIEQHFSDRLAEIEAGFAAAVAEADSYRLAYEQLLAERRPIWRRWFGG